MMEETTKVALAQLQSEYNDKVRIAQGIGAAYKSNPQAMTAEVAKQIQTAVGEAETVKARIQAVTQLESLQETGELAVAPLAWRNAAPQEAEFPTDGKSYRKFKGTTIFGQEREVRYNMPRFLDSHKKEAQYSSAWEAYMRTRGGLNAIGPNDAKTLAEGTDAVGGFTVPPDVMTQIIKKVMTITQMRARAFLSTTSRDVQVWPKITYATDDNFTSAIRLTWSGEAPATSATIRASDPAFGLVTVPINTAMASLPMTNDILEDTSVDLVSIITDLFAEAFALGEEQAFISGTGVAQPMGLFSEVGTNGPSSITSIAVGALGGDDLIKLYYALPVQYRQNAAWMLNSPTMQAAELLKDSQNRYLISSLTVASLQTPQFDNIKNKPILIDEFAPSIATNNFPIMYGDFSGYLIVDRVGLSIQRLNEVYAELNLALFLARKRVGGYAFQPWKFRALKIQ